MSLTLLMNLLLPNLLPPLLTRFFPSQLLLSAYLPPLILLLPPIISLPQNIYQILNTSPQSPASNAFKNWARKNHPDVANRRGGGKRRGVPSEELFGEVRSVWEGVKDGGTKKIAYERFGPQALTWTDCVTFKEYLQRGLGSAIMWYIFTGGAMIFFSIVFGGRGQPSFWRYTLFLLLFFVELYLSVLPTTALPTLPIPFLQQTITFQHVRFAHDTFFILSSLVSRFDHSPQGGHIERMRKIMEIKISEIVGAIENLGRVLNSEVDKMFTSQIASFQPQASASSPGAPLDMDAETIKYLSQALERLIIDRRIEGNEYLRELRDEVVRVHREGGGVEEDEEETVVAFSVRNQGEGKVVL